MNPVRSIRPRAAPTAFALAFVFAMLSSIGSAGANGASDVVQRFHERLMPVLGAESAITSGQRIGPIRAAVDDAFHMPLIGRLVVGGTWNELDRATKQRLTSAILQLNVATYLSRLGDQRLRGHRVDGVRAGANSTLLVDATIDATSGPLRLTYVTRELKGRWWIIDVLLDGQFSELEVRRNEYRGLIAQSGVPGLIDALEQQTAELTVSGN
ncbi:MAG: ABC transporter substrate-binding protein [Rhodospirillales bacterium]